MPWSYNLSRGRRGAFVREYNRQRDRVDGCRMPALKKCDAELASVSSLEDACAALRKFAGSVAGFSDFEGTKYLALRLYKCCNWAAHSQHELIRLPNGDLINTTITDSTLCKIEGYLTDVIDFLVAKEEEWCEENSDPDEDAESVEPDADVEDEKEEADNEIESDDEVVG